MAARWMAPKLAKMQRDRKSQLQPGSHRSGHTVATSNALSAEVAALCKEYTGVVTLCKPDMRGASSTWRKRGGSMMGCGMGSAIAPDGHKGVARNTNGNYYELWSTAGDRLVSSR